MTEAPEDPTHRRHLVPVACFTIEGQPDGIHLSVNEWVPTFEEWATGLALCGKSAEQGALPAGTVVTCQDCEGYRESYEQVLAGQPTAEQEQPAEADEELTREELQAMVDELGTDLYRAQDLIAFVREMCDAADADGSPVTTERVRGWLGYTGCGGVLVLPETTLRTPATQVSEPLLPVPALDVEASDAARLVELLAEEARRAVAGPATGEEQR